MRRLLLAALTASTLALSALPAAAADTAQAGGETDYVVLFAEGASQDAAHAAVAAAGGTVVAENTAVGVATVRTANPGFVTDASAQAAIDGAATDRAVGQAVPLDQPKLEDVELQTAEGAGVADVQATPFGEPLAHLQWGNEMIDATPDGSYAVQPGDERVLVGILDTGVDGSHPDIAPNFDAALSRNFTVDDPLVDGACADDPDGSCNDPADVDENGHGTHVAGTIAAPINDLGTGGVAPNVTLVNLRAGQDSGFFFLQPTIDALTYAADNGVDVVNMSYYIDPWQYNCPNNPADSPEDQLEQQTIIAATQRAVDYAHERNVTLISSLGNDDQNLDNPTFDDTSPDYPPGIEYPRTIDNSCVDLPTEAEHVLSVTALGPSERKAYYSNWGLEQTTVSAPGGDRNDYLGTSRYRSPENLILAPYPLSVLIEAEEVDEDGLPVSPFVVRDCRGDVCGYYRYLQGTSMAGPHAVGVASLIVSEYGRGRRDIHLNPDRVERILRRTATDHACPEPRLATYVVGDPPVYNPEFDAYCEGDADFNGFYGDGIVNALRAVTRR